ncbi:hypothetical protein SM124_18870 [Bacillus sp. 31A1R]|uniref:Uncharacterized protein n=1 Tax=Robertmurraya mangrovi TaxID=3098077 RepID=A0ABU5J345_9BACI|nr:hypothetical protein [Bacillus sp. 31A1R]MDZ5473785.1 hypothetical protein [Bacillus sp. 31A1R]
MNEKDFNEDNKKHSRKDHFGLEEEMSLQSVQFATTLNTYLNERAQAEEFEND